MEGLRVWNALTLFPLDGFWLKTDDNPNFEAFQNPWYL